MSYLQDRTANPANLAAIFCHALVGLSSKSHRGNNFFCIFLQSSCQVGMKNAVKYSKDFLLYFTTLEIYCVLLQRKTNDFKWLHVSRYLFLLKQEREDKIKFYLVLKFIAPLDISFLKLVDTSLFSILFYIRIVCK